MPSYHGACGIFLSDGVRASRQKLRQVIALVYSLNEDTATQLTRYCPPLVVSSLAPGLCVFHELCVSTPIDVYTSSGTFAMIDPTVSPSRVRTAPASTIKNSMRRWQFVSKHLASCKVVHTCTCVSRGDVSVTMYLCTKCVCDLWFTAGVSLPRA